MVGDGKWPYHAWEPDLTNREAICFYCKTVRVSSTELPFFEYRGPGSNWAELHCKTCEKNSRVHYERVESGADVHDYVPGGRAGTDSFYCGCRGWD